MFAVLWAITPATAVMDKLYTAGFCNPSGDFPKQPFLLFYGQCACIPLIRKAWHFLKYNSHFQRLLRRNFDGFMV